jgi:hypothetical protein
MLNGKDIVKRGFHKAFCDLCQREVWHYKSADHTAASCSNHSNWEAGKHRVRVEGSTLIVAKLTKDHGEAPTERELRVANALDKSLWQFAEEKRTSQVDISSEAWAENIFDDAPPMRDPNKTYCTFCGTEVQKIDLLTERKPIIRKTEDAYRNASGEIVIQERITTRMETINACPNCSLKVRKPVVVRIV